MVDIHRCSFCTRLYWCQSELPKLQVYDRWAPEGKVQRKTDRQGGLARARAFETPTQRPAGNRDVGFFLCSEIEIYHDLPEICRKFEEMIDIFIDMLIFRLNLPYPYHSSILLESSRQIATAVEERLADHTPEWAKFYPGPGML